MANRLRRLLFRAPAGARSATLLEPFARPFASPGTAFSSFFRTLRVTAAGGGTLRLGHLPAERPLSPPAAPAVETVLVLVHNPRQDVRPLLQFARGLGANVHGIYLEEDGTQTPGVMAEWALQGDGVPLLVLEGEGLPVAKSLRSYVDLLARAGELAVLLPPCESGTRGAKIRRALKHLMMRLALGSRAGVRVYAGLPKPTGGQAGAVETGLQCARS